MKGPANVREMEAAAERVSALMKTLGHKDRLLVLCNLAEGERAVGELAAKLNLSQSSLSQHLARMRIQGLVETRRESQTIYYSLRDGDVRELIESLYKIFCPS
ncbi:MAG: metalloregulator ArsR/SmtB family transcription factor [Woeseiaceae bacterium]